MVRKDAWNDFSFFEFIKVKFMAQDVIYPGEGSVRKRWNSLFWGEMSYRYQLGLTGLLYHLKGVSLLIFCLVDLSIGVSGVLKSPTIIVLLLISPFILISICLTYCGAPMLGAYIFIILIYIFFLDWSFDHYVGLSLSLFMAFISKSISSDMSNATPAFFGSPFVWNIFF